MPSAPGTIGPRLDRGDASVTVQGAMSGASGGTVPRTRIWSWYMDVAQNQRTIRVSPPFNGPAMILEMTWRYWSANNARNWALFWSNDDGGTLTAGLPTIRPSGTPIFETRTFSSAVAAVDADEISETIEQVSNAADPVQGPVMRPRFIVPTLDRFFLKVTAGGGTGGGGTFRGVITVVEASSFEQLANFS